MSVSVAKATGVGEFVNVAVGPGSWGKVASANAEGEAEAIGPAQPARRLAITRIVEI